MKFVFGGHKSLVWASKIEKRGSKVCLIHKKDLSLQCQEEILGYAAECGE